MEKELEKVYQVLQKLIGLHRRLLELVRAENSALEQLQTKELQEIVYNKEVLIHDCKLAELERVRGMATLGAILRQPIADIALSKFVEILQGINLKEAERFRSVQNTLKILLDRISDQNKTNRAIVEKSLEHVLNMKRNVLGEATAKNETYTSKGKRSDATAGSRLLSREV